VRAAFLAVALGVTLAAAPADDAADVRARDDAFWQAYNRCDVAAFRGFFTGDVEFYHDRGGVTTGLDALDAALKKNLCGGDTRLRREPIAETIRISILRDGERVYGAIVSGEHVFYVTQPGKPEFLDGRARFANLWRLADGTWKMSRILSYDHGPATGR
jgi:hypothetical protein